MHKGREWERESESSTKGFILYLYALEPIVNVVRDRLERSREWQMNVKSSSLYALPVSRSHSALIKFSFQDEERAKLKSRKRVGRLLFSIITQK